MKQFQFKLESVLNYRITLEGLAKNEYREALRLLNIEKEGLRQMEESQGQLMAFYDIKAGSVVEPDTLMFVSRYSSQLVALIRRQKTIIGEKEDILNDKFILWNKRRQEVKVVERLKEKKWNLYLREAEKEDQRFQDEIFISRQIRETKEGQTYE
ncbi:MAG: flagellar export protein FliJ [bacterium]|nr:flagellar export protein FliJ [bacterium]